MHPDHKTQAIVLASLLFLARHGVLTKDKVFDVVGPQATGPMGRNSALLHYLADELRLSWQQRQNMLDNPGTRLNGNHRLKIANKLQLEGLDIDRFLLEAIFSQTVRDKTPKVFTQKLGLAVRNATLILEDDELIGLEMSNRSKRLAKRGLEYDGVYRMMRRAFFDRPAYALDIVRLQNNGSTCAADRFYHPKRRYTGVLELDKDYGCLVFRSFRQDGRHRDKTSVLLFQRYEDEVLTPHRKVGAITGGLLTSNERNVLAFGTVLERIPEHRQAAVIAGIDDGTLAHGFGPEFDRLKREGLAPNRYRSDADVPPAVHPILERYRGLHERDVFRTPANEAYLRVLGRNPNP